MKLRALLCLALGVACAYRRSNEPRPERVLFPLEASPAQVTEFEVSEVSPERVDFGLALQVRNPHALTGRLDRVSWELFIDGRWFAAGTLVQDVVLAPGGVQELHLVLRTAFGRRTQSGGVPSAVFARLRGDLRAQFQTGEEQFPLDWQGALKTQGAPLADPLSEP